MLAAMSSPVIEVEPASMKNSGRCACCGKSRRTAWGFVYRDGGPRACYFVEWTLGRRDCAARVDVVVGEWFDGTTEDDREAVSLEYRLLESGPSFTLGDVADRPAAEVGRTTKGAEIAGTPLAIEVLSLAGIVLRGDPRLQELVRDGPAVVAKVG